MTGPSSSPREVLEEPDVEVAKLYNRTRETCLGTRALAKEVSTG
jgi:hypothetical protein